MGKTSPTAVGPASPYTHMEPSRGRTVLLHRWAVPLGLYFCLHCFLKSFYAPGENQNKAVLAAKDLPWVLFA